MSAIPNMSAPPSGGADFRDVATAHTPFRPGRLVLWIIIVLFATNFAWIVAHNENFGWPVVAQYFFDPTVISGLYISLGLTVVAMAIGTVLGLIIAIARLSNDRLASSFASLFIWFFRGTPLLVQLIFWYNMSTLFPQLSIAVPFGPTLASWDTNSVITPMTAAIVGLALNEAAYMAEIIRGGLLSVDRGQAETAEAFGMTKARALWRIIIPQAMRSIVPPTGNQPDQHDQGNLAGQRDRHGGSALLGPVDLQPHIRDHPDADGCGHLVSAHHLDPQCWSKLHRGLLRPQ